MRTFALLLCALPGVALALDYNESVSGDITGHEGAPTLLGDLSLGTNTVVGTVDPIQDSFEVNLPAGAQILSATLEVNGYQSLGQQGFVRFFRTTPFNSFGETWLTGNGVYDVPVDNIVGINPISFTAASMGPSGAVYNYRLTLEVGSPCVGGTVVWDEMADGDLPGDENHPFFLQSLTPGSYTLCGTVDPFQDTFWFDLPYGRRMNTLTVDVDGFTTLGQDGMMRTIAPSPFGVYEQFIFGVDGLHTFNTSLFASQSEVGFTAASIGPSGALYSWTMHFDVLAGPEIGVSTPPRAGQRANFMVNGVSPGRTVTLVAGRTMGSTAIPFCPGVSAEVRSPSVLGSRAATPGGSATFTVNIPATMAGQTVYLQALDHATCTLTPLASFTL